MISRRLTLFVILSQPLLLPLLNLRHFRLRIKFFARELLGTLQRCKGVVGPDSLKVGLTVGCTWRSPRSLCRSRGLRLRCCCCSLARGRYNRGPTHSY